MIFFGGGSFPEYSHSDIQWDFPGCLRYFVHHMHWHTCNFHIAFYITVRFPEHYILATLFELTFASRSTFPACSATQDNYGSRKEIIQDLPVRHKVLNSTRTGPWNSSVMGGLCRTLIHLTIVRCSKSNAATNNVFISARQSFPGMLGTYIYQVLIVLLLVSSD